MTTRIAALYDIHGNLPALEAVLRDAAVANVAQIVIGGDALPGPMPRETLSSLMALTTPVQFVYGNGEVAVLQERAGQVPAVPKSVRETIHWNASQIDDAAISLIRSWPLTVSLDTGVGRAVFCHATPRNENECFTRLTPEEKLLPIFRDVNAALVVCGHTHIQFDRTVGDVRIINAGSVGMPFGRPGADWLLIDDGDIVLKHTDYNLMAAAERIRATDYPQRDEFAARNILNPATAAEMEAVFARAELRP